MGTICGFLLAMRQDKAHSPAVLQVRGRFPDEGRRHLAVWMRQAPLGTPAYSRCVSILGTAPGRVAYNDVGLLGYYCGFREEISTTDCLPRWISAGLTGD